MFCCIYTAYSDCNLDCMIEPHFVTCIYCVVVVMTAAVAVAVVVAVAGGGCLPTMSATALHTQV